MKRIILTLLLLTNLVFTGCASQVIQSTGHDSKEAVEIYISAAASLTEALTELKCEYENNNNVLLIFNFAGSGTLQKQILEGAPCDIFISASKEHMDSVEEAGLILENSRKNLLNNTLTLIGSAELEENLPNAKSMDFNDIFTAPEITTISIGTPESVPAGKYARESLKNLGIWDSINTKLVLAKDVKQVLEYIESGNIDLGLVYKTDAMLLETGFIIKDMPENSHSPIVYPSALLASHQDEAEAFYGFLQSEPAKNIFKKYGFNTI